MENAGLIIQIGLLIASIITAFITAKVTISNLVKTQESQDKKIAVNDVGLKDMELKLQSKISYEHADKRYVTKEELNLHLKNIELKQQRGIDKTDDVLEILKELKSQMKSN